MILNHERLRPSKFEIVNLKTDVFCKFTNAHENHNTKTQS